MSDTARRLSFLPNMGSRGLVDFARIAEGEMREEFEELRRQNEQSLNATIERLKAQWLQDDRERLCEWAQAICKVEGRIDELDEADLRSILCRAIEGQDPTTVRSILAVVADDPELKKEIGLDLETNPLHLSCDDESDSDECNLSFSRDFRSCRWGNDQFEFSPTQAAVVEILFEEWTRGTPVLAQATILEFAGSAASKIRDVFRNHRALNLLIVPGKASGTWRLAPEPPSNS